MKKIPKGHGFVYEYGCQICRTLGAASLRVTCVPLSYRVDGARIRIRITDKRELAYLLRKEFLT